MSTVMLMMLMMISKRVLQDFYSDDDADDDDDVYKTSIGILEDPYRISIVMMMMISA